MIDQGPLGHFTSFKTSGTVSLNWKKRLNRLLGHVPYGGSRKNFQKVRNFIFRQFRSVNTNQMYSQVLHFKMIMFSWEDSILRQFRILAWTTWPGAELFLVGWPFVTSDPYGTALAHWIKPRTHRNHTCAEISFHLAWIAVWMYQITRHFYLLSKSLHFFNFFHLTFLVGRLVFRLPN